VNRHARHKQLYWPKEHVDVYLSVLGGMFHKGYVAKQGSVSSFVAMWVAAFAAVAAVAATADV